MSTSHWQRMTPLLLLPLLLRIAGSRAADDLDTAAAAAAYPAWVPVPGATTAPQISTLGAAGGPQGRGREALTVLSWRS